MEVQLSFEQYLESKNIDIIKFKSAEPDQYQELAVDFKEMHPNSFTAHYLFLINPLRRKYLLIHEGELTIEKPKVKMRPKIIPKN